MKKGMIVAICAVIVLVIAGTILFLQRQPMLEKPGRLQINGAELTNAQVTIGDHYAMLPPPGGQRRYRVEGQELVLDDNTLECMFYLLGEQLHIQIDYEKAIVSVTHSGPP